MTNRIVNTSSTLNSDVKDNPENYPRIDSTAKQDISKHSMDNKLNNTIKVSCSSILGTICNFFNAYTDDSFLYVPFRKTTQTITKRNESWKEEKYRQEIIQLHAPNPSNNYAEICIRFSENISYFIKICRIDTLHAIPFDGHLLTFAEGSISPNNFFVFYSVNPKETNKLLIISSQEYYMFSMHNGEGKSHFRLFDIDDLDRVKEKLGLNDNMIKLLNIEESIDSLNDNQLLNIEHKRESIIKYIEMILKMKEAHNGGIVHQRTHFGEQYTAINLISGTVIQLRDCHARNEFFKNQIHRSLPSNSVIRRNTDIMQQVIRGEKVDSYKVNIYDDGWVILAHYTDIDALLTAVKVLLQRLSEKSKRLAKRISAIMEKAGKDCILLIETIKKEVSNIRKNIRKKVKYFVSLKWYCYMISTDFPNLKDYRKQLIC